MLVSKNEGLRQKSAKTENYVSLHLKVSGEKRSRGQFLILVCLVNFSILWEGIEFIKGASRKSCLAF